MCASYDLEPYMCFVVCHAIFIGVYVIHLQRIYNFGLLHAILSTVLGNIGLYFPLLYYFCD